MTRWWAWSVIGAILVAAIAAAFLWPHQMVSPGNLRAAHAALQQDCFACHKPFAGASPEKCIACHKVADIGRFTTKGEPVRMSRSMPPFHQALTEKNCMACHSDHPAPRLAAQNRAKFDHALLSPAMRGTCQSCHRAPQDTLHRSMPQQSCAQCHKTTGWRPATFDHSRFFLLDGDHNASCTTCHKTGNFKQYTCYGCHEHQPDGIRAKHAEEGIRNIDNCVRCHRSASEHGEGREGGEGGGED